MIWLITNNLDFQTSQSTLQQLRVLLIEYTIQHLLLSAFKNFVNFRTSYGLKFRYVDSVKINGFDTPIPRYTHLNMPFELMPEHLNDIKAKLGHAFSDSISFVESLPSPRCMRSHLCTHLLPEGIETVKPKVSFQVSNKTFFNYLFQVIYVMREPKDLCVSYYFYLKMGHKFEIDFEDFCELFMNDALPLGSVFHHYLDFWNKRHEPNYLILRYEEMLAEPRKTVKKIASHLNKSLNDEDIDAICEFVAFKNMKQNKSCNLEVSFKTVFLVVA